MKSDLDNPTPLLNLSKVITTHKKTKFYAKIQLMNPFGSVKDRYTNTIKKLNYFYFLLKNMFILNLFIYLFNIFKN